MDEVDALKHQKIQKKQNTGLGEMGKSIIMNAINSWGQGGKTKHALIKGAIGAATAGAGHLIESKGRKQEKSFMQEQEKKRNEYDAKENKNKDEIQQHKINQYIQKEQDRADQKARQDRLDQENAQYKGALLALKTATANSKIKVDDSKIKKYSSSGSGGGNGKPVTTRDVAQQAKDKAEKKINDIILRNITSPEGQIQFLKDPEGTKKRLVKEKKGMWGFKKETGKYTLAPDDTEKEEEKRRIMSALGAM